MAGNTGNVSYIQRSSANPGNNTAYSKFLSALDLDVQHRVALRNRGLDEEIIKLAFYRTKHGNNNQGLQQAIASLERQAGIDLDNLPGFYTNKRGQRTCSGSQGLIIPSRDLEGNIQSLLIRQEGNVRHKYVAFSHKEGKPARNTTHCPITHSFKSRAEIGTTIRLTEGLLKADIACFLDKSKYTLGIHGLKKTEDLEWILQELEVSKVLIAFDMETTSDVRKTKLSLYKSLKQDFEVTFEVWDEKFKGIDDALLHAPDSIRELGAEELLTHIDLTADPNTSPYIYVIKTDKFYHLEDCSDLTPAQFSATFYMEGPAEVLSLLSAGNRPLFPRCDEIEFAPGQSQTFNVGRKSKFNTWRPNPIEPAEGDVGPFIKHMEYIIPDPTERHIMMQWMAHQRQLLGEKINWAVLLQGPPGIGKSFLANVMAALLGPSNISKPSNQELHEIYSSWEKQCSLVIVEEVMVSDKQDLMNKLKPKITEPMTRVRQMHKESYEQPNRYNMLLLTNFENAIRIDDTDRRYFIIYSPAQHQAPAYYDELFEWVTMPDSIAALQYWALTYDMTGFIAKGHAPKTEARKELVVLSRNKLEEYVVSNIEDRAWPFQMDIISVGDLKRSQHIPKEFALQHERRWANALKLAGAIHIKQQIDLGDGVRRRLWAVRRPELWTDKDLSATRIIEELRKWSGNSQPGGNIHDDNFPMQA